MRDEHKTEEMECVYPGLEVGALSQLILLDCYSCRQESLISSLGNESAGVKHTHTHTLWNEKTIHAVKQDSSFSLYKVLIRAILLT